MTEAGRGLSWHLHDQIVQCRDLPAFRFRETLDTPPPEHPVRPEMPGASTPPNISQPLPKQVAIRFKLEMATAKTASQDAEISDLQLTLRRSHERQERIEADHRSLALHRIVSEPVQRV